MNEADVNERVALAERLRVCGCPRAQDELTRIGGAPGDDEQGREAPARA